MLLSHLFRSRTSIGLDIQSSEIRLLQLQYSKNHISVVQAGVTELPGGAIVDDAIQQPEIVCHCLKNLIQMTKTAGQIAAIALPAHRVFSTKVSMPSGLGEIERAAEIEENLNNCFPMLDNAMAYDYAVLNTHDADTENMLLVAARAEQLNSFINVVERAGLKVKQVDVDIYALTRAVEFALTIQDSSQIIPFVNMSDQMTQVIMVYKNEIISHQQFFNKTIAEICHQIQFGLQFCYQRFSNIKIRRIYLFGFVSVLSSAIQKELAIDTEYINPFEKMSYPAELSTLLKKMLLCCGLALRKNAT